MKASDIKVSIKDTFDDFMLIEEGKEVYSYENGKKTDNVEYIGYTLFSTKLWEKITVKVKGKVPTIDYQGNPIPITLDNPKAKVWFDYKANEIKISLTADGIQIANNKAKITRGEKTNEV